MTCPFSRKFKVSLKCRANLRLHFIVALQALLKIKGYVSVIILQERHWPVLIRDNSPIKLCSKFYLSQLDRGLQRPQIPLKDA